jgi:ELWxxDGT repeat protein
VNGIELWRSDGTPAGTVLVKNINPGGDSSPSQLKNFNGALAFTADDGSHGRELWRSDGTGPGTMQVRNMQSANEVTYSLIVKVNAGTPAGTIISNTANVSNFTPDPVPGNNSVTTTTSVVAFNAQPVLSNIEATPLNYIESDPPTSITTSLALADFNNFSFVGATIAITGNYLATEDVLGFTNQSGITGSFNSSTGLLALSGSSSRANYETALHAVTYRNTSYFPSTLNRVVRFQVNDGAPANNLSNIVTRAISITALDDTPRIVSIASEVGFPGTYRLTFGGIASRTYTIEFTNELDPADWQPLGTTQANAQGIFAILDTPPPGVLRRFYRARFP